MHDRMIDPRDLRRALGTFATGVTIVTTLDVDGRPRGFTANSFTSVSLEPPLVLVCVAKTASSCPVFVASPAFAINILAEDQRDASAAFASRQGDRFAAVRWIGRTTGSPIIAGSAAWLDCRRHETIDAGDHVILVGRVVDYEYGTASPLGYCRGAYVTFGLAEEAIEAAGEDGTLRVGAIVERSGAVLLERDPTTGAVRLPTARHLGSASDPKSLRGRLAASGVDADLTFLFAVFEDPGSRMHFVFYRGEARAVAAEAERRFVPFAAIPWGELADDAIRIMLRRYVREREEDAFGIYVGDVTSGTVSPIAKQA